MKVRLQRRGWLLVAAVIALAVAGCSEPDPVSSWTPLPPPTVTPTPTPSSTLPPGWDPTWTENQMIAARMVGDYWAMWKVAANTKYDEPTWFAPFAETLAEEAYEQAFNDIAGGPDQAQVNGAYETVAWQMGEEAAVDGRQQILVTTCVDRSSVTFSNRLTGEAIPRGEYWTDRMEDTYTVAWVTEFLEVPGWRIVERTGNRPC